MAKSARSKKKKHFRTIKREKYDKLYERPKEAERKKILDASIKQQKEEEERKKQEEKENVAMLTEKDVSALAAKAAAIAAKRVKRSKKGTGKDKEGDAKMDASGSGDSKEDAMDLAGGDGEVETVTLSSQTSAARLKMSRRQKRKFLAKQKAKKMSKKTSQKGARRSKTPIRW